MKSKFKKEQTFYLFDISNTINGFYNLKYDIFNIKIFEILMI